MDPTQPSLELEELQKVAGSRQPVSVPKFLTDIPLNSTDDMHFIAFKKRVLQMIEHIHSSDPNDMEAYNRNLQQIERCRSYILRGTEILFNSVILVFNMIIDGLNVDVKITYRTDYVNSCILELNIHHSPDMVVISEDIYIGTPIIFISNEQSDFRNEYIRLHQHSSLDTRSKLIPIRNLSQPIDKNAFVLLQNGKLALSVTEFDNNIRKIWDLLEKIKTYKICQFDRILIPPEKFDDHNQYNAMKCYIEGYTTACCVCYTVTKTHTSCGHPLCVKCWQKLRTMKKRRCPCCRNPSLSYMNCDSDEEESDDE